MDNFEMYTNFINFLLSNIGKDIKMDRGTQKQTIIDVEFKEISSERVEEEKSSKRK